MAMSVDGLVTGMSTTDTVNQLIKVEALPQTALKNRVTVQNKAVTALQNVNTKLAAIVTAAKALGSKDTWGAIKATSSSDAAVVTAAPGASPGTLSFRVESLAATHVTTFSSASVASTSGNVLADGSSFSLELSDGSTKTFSTADGSLASNSLSAVVSAINGEAGAAYKAAAVQIGNGQYTLQLTAKEGGDAGVFTDVPTGLTLGAASVTVQGTDAKLRIGDGAGAYLVESKTNTFTDVLPGVTITAVRAQAPTDPLITATLSADSEAMATKVQTLVDNVNAALGEIATQTKTKKGEAAAGPLAGDSALRKITQDLLSAVSNGADGLGSLSEVGVELDRNGRLTFDKTKFQSSFSADPARTQSFFDSYADNTTDPKAVTGKFEPGWDQAKGVARKLEMVALIASDGVILPTDPVTKPKQGIVEGLIERRNSFIRDLNDQVAAWDIRLERRKTMLQRQFSGLEVAMGKMQQQSTWLAGQLASLPTY